MHKATTALLLAATLVCAACSQPVPSAPKASSPGLRASVPATNAVASSLGQLELIQPRAASRGMRGIVTTVVVPPSDIVSITVAPGREPGQTVLRLRLDSAAVTVVSRLMRSGSPYVDVFASLPYPHSIAQATITHPVVDGGILEVRLASDSPIGP